MHIQTRPEGDTSPVRGSTNGSAVALDGAHLRLHGGVQRTEKPQPTLVVPAAPRAPRISLRSRLVLFDSLAIVIGWLIAFAIRPPTQTDAIAPAIALAVLLGITATATSRLYQARVSTVRSTEFARLGPVALVAASPALLVPILIHREEHVAATIGLAALLFLLLVAERSFFDAWLRSQRSKSRYCRSLVIVGTATEARDLSVLLRDHAEFGYRVVGFVGPDPAGDVLPAGSPWLGDVDTIMHALDDTGANGVLIASDALPAQEMGPLVRDLSRAGIHIHLSGGLWGLDHRRIRSLPIAHEPLFYVEPLKLGQTQSAMKRVVDVVVASVSLVITSPIIAIAAIAIRLEDGGPVFFRQPRVGLNGVEFSLIKLRTMKVGASDDDEEEIPGNGREGPLFKARTRDPRVTRAGRLLRAMSLDELPQLINVLHGEMSLVGPRPALQSEIDQFDDELLTRHRIRPGLTGLWQVESRDNPSFRPYRRLDLFYVENWSMMLDIVILLMTVEVVVTRAFTLMRDKNASELLDPDDAVIDLRQ